MKKLFGKEAIDVIVEGRSILFNLDDVAYAAGYAKTASLEHHLRGTKYYIRTKTAKVYTNKAGLEYAAKLANRTPLLKSISDWAKKIKLADFNQPAERVVKPHVVPASWPVPTPVLANTLIGIREAATKLGMTTKELSDWLVDQGHAARYAGNNAIYWLPVFKKSCYGTRPIIKDEKGERESNVAKLTMLGFEYVKRRLASDREASVLNFVKKESTEAEKLEAEVDKLIMETFNRYIDANDDFYNIPILEIAPLVKGVIAQVKLKEIKT